MKEELELKLQEEFPFMKREAVDDRKAIRNTYQLWGCECSAGWYDLIRELCQKITKRYAEEGTSANEIDLTVLQIKEKFATLRFYYTFNDAHCSLQAIDFIGTASLRFEPQNDGDDEGTGKLKHDISEIVRSYEEWSAHLCEYCGKSGTIRMDMVWKRTLCDECYGEYITKMREHEAKKE